MKWMSIKRVLVSGWKNFARGGAVSAATVLIMTVTLAIIGSLIFLSALLTFTLNTIKNKVDVSVYFVTTASDPEHRPTVTDFFKGGERVFPVGRLDYSSEGLLLMTNDGDLANALTRAAARVEKTYLVKVSGKPSESAIDQLRHGDGPAEAVA